MKKAIGLIVLNKKYLTGRECILLYEALLEEVDEVFLLCNDMKQIQYTNKSVRRFFRDVRFFESYQEAKKIFVAKGVEYLYICNNSFFGPLDKGATLWERFTEFDTECLGLEQRNKHIDEYGVVQEAYLQSYFMCLKRVIWENDEFEKCLVSDELDDLKFNSFLKAKGFTYRALFAENSGENVYMENAGLINPYNMIKNGFPVFRKDAMELDRIELLGYNYAEQIKKAILYLEKQKRYETDVIKEYMIDRFSPDRVRDLLELNYVIDSDVDKRLSDEVYSETVIAAHLFYIDKFAEALEYFNELDERIDIYITVASEEAKETLCNMLGQKKKQYKVLVSSNIGRDWGALIIDLWPHIRKYKYICFLHDKKTTGGNGYESVGKTFMDMTWNCLIHSKRYVDRILDKLISDDRLGLLVPPKPYHSGYIKLLGDSWTICYEEAAKLWKMLGYTDELEEDSEPYALASMFWFKRDALLPIFANVIQKRDFPGEPMKTDGTFNHALERIVVYVAKKQGFYTATVQAVESAHNTITNYEFMLKRIVKDLLMTFGEQSIERMFSGNAYFERLEMLKFVMENTDVYIYGAGNNGKRIADFLKQQELVFKGFIVSDGYRKNDFFDKMPIYELHEINCQAGIILAVDDIYKAEIAKNLEEGFFENVFVVNG